jgi:aminomuconate-semialdehyde/2-hydroxymuconate-6-semialdehyde dehydrogenase
VFHHDRRPTASPVLNYALRRPKGVVAVVCPWNLPLLADDLEGGPALACGNTVVVKPSEETPATATLLGEVMNEVGVPPASTTWCMASARLGR